MSQKNLLLFALLSLLLFGILYTMKQNAAEAFREEKRQLASFEKEAKEIGMLKKRFSDKRAQERTLLAIKRIATPKKELTKGKLKIMEFDLLDGTKLNALLRKVENSGLQIQRLMVDRIDDLHAKVRLEIVR